MKLALQVLPHGSENNIIVEIFYGAKCNLEAVEFKVKIGKTARSVDQHKLCDDLSTAPGNWKESRVDHDLY